jgi:Flp pilus assembly protein TadG
MTGNGGAGERGTVAVTVALALTVLLGIAALVVDVGLSWAARAEAQTAADAAALAGASRLAAGPLEAVAAVRQYLDANVAGLANGPADPGWPLNGTDEDGEVVCWTLPAAPPGPGAGCPAGADALQVTTPPITVHYAFAPILGSRSNQIRALAAASAGPALAAPGGCALCLLDPARSAALAVAGTGDVVVDGGRVAVASARPDAAVLSDRGDVVADETAVVGGVVLSSSGRFVPPATTGASPLADPLAGLPTPDALPAPPPCCSGRVTVAADRTLTPGVYDSITVTGHATLTLAPGTYVLTELPGLAVLEHARVRGAGVTIYLACAAYPGPCDGLGAGLSLTADASYEATAPTGGPYAGVAVFADRDNPTPILLASAADTAPTGAVYARSARLVLASSGDLQTSHPLVLGRLLTLSTGSVRVTPHRADARALQLPTQPVLIR